MNEIAKIICPKWLLSGISQFTSRSSTYIGIPDEDCITLLLARLMIRTVSTVGIKTRARIRVRVDSFSRSRLALEYAD